MVSVIMPTHNKAIYLNLTLLAYCRQTSKNFEILLIDDGSTDNTMEICRKYENYIDIKYIYQKKGNVSQARNAGLDSAKGDIIVFADDDRIPCENYIREIEKRLLNKKNIVLIGYKKEILTVYQNFLYDQELVNKIAYKKLNYEENEVISYGKVLVNDNDILQNFTNTVNQLFLRVPYDNYEFVIDKFGCDLAGFKLGWAMATTANIAFKKVGVETVRFDEKYVGWGVEDIDYAYQLKERGFNFIFCKTAVNYHQKHVVSMNKKKTLKRNMAYFASKFPNLDVFLYYQSFQSQDRTFNYIKCNDILNEISKPECSDTWKSLIKHLLSVWKVQQKGLLEE